MFDGWCWTYPGYVADYEVTDPDDSSLSIVAEKIDLAMKNWNIAEIRSQYQEIYAEYFTGTRMYARLNSL